MRYWQCVGLLTAAVSIGSVGYAQTLQVGNTQPGDPGNAFEISEAEEAQAFTAANDFVATSASFWTDYEGPDRQTSELDGVSGVFDWALYSSDNGLPGAVISSGKSTPTVQSVLTAAFDGSIDRVRWSLDLPDVTMHAGTEYWLGIHNTDNTGVFQHTGLYWTADILGPYNNPGSVHRTSESGAWTPNAATDAPYFGNGNHLTLAIYGDSLTTTPEPTSLALLGTGLVGLVPMIRRKR